ncbi:MAG: hypothetical protein V3S00_06890 [Dehalococcoidia bacterium]
MIQIVCWLWDDPRYRYSHLFRYTANHVNVLASMVRRNLTMEHEIVCITDMPEGIDPSIRIVPIWDDLREMGGCYVRLKAFAPEMKQLIGDRFVWIDVDCVIVGRLDSLFNRPEDFVIWSHAGGRLPYCASMVMMDAGARRQVWDDFDQEAAPAIGDPRRAFGTDQSWICERLPGEAVWDRKDGVLSRIDVGLTWRRPVPHGLPRGAKIVFFHGPYDPASMTGPDWVTENWR